MNILKYYSEIRNELQVSKYANLTVRLCFVISIVFKPHVFINLSWGFLAFCLYLQVSVDRKETWRESGITCIKGPPATNQTVGVAVCT